jgi:hypothetical protein
VQLNVLRKPSIASRSKETFHVVNTLSTMLFVCVGNFAGRDPVRWVDVLKTERWDDERQIVMKSLTSPIICLPVPIIPSQRNVASARIVKKKFRPRYNL